MELTFGAFADALNLFLAQRTGAQSDKLWRQISAGWDGDQFCILVGPNLQEGQGFFGATPDAAMEAFLSSLMAK